jgi:hypothetical protein
LGAIASPRVNGFNGLAELPDAGLRHAERNDLVDVLRIGV